MNSETNSPGAITSAPNVQDIDNFFCLLTSSDATTAMTAAEELSHQIASNAINDSVLKAYLAKAGVKPFATHQKIVPC